MRRMPIDLGMPTLLEMADIPGCASLCASLGFRFVELNMNQPTVQPDRIDERALADAMERYGIYFTLHLDEAFSPCDSNPYVAEAYTRTALMAISLAKRFCMPIINLHMNPGVYFSLPNERVYLFERYERQFTDDLRRFRDQCDAAARGGGVTLCVETCDGWPAFIRRGIDCLFESEAFGLTLDVGHSHCAAGVDEPYVFAKPGRLRHMHLHDAKGAECHLPLGQGALDLPRMLDLAKENGCRAVVEVKTIDGLRQAKEWFDDHL